MRIFERQRLTSFVLLAAYLTATTAGELFHTHPPHSVAGRSHVDEHDHAACEHHAHQSHESHSDEHALCVAEQHQDDCAACRFLGQRVVAPPIAELDRSAERIELLAASQPLDPSIPVTRAAHSRGPPASG